ncbi:hypothetical protein BLA60_27010 [Actinophytocola xinjiangensis]|uniref:Uncharacterized protein n=1 Tax=Actinophytocola xinjiangensis TaxID=485602 RepID=A0A7Z1AXC6_9PSEU|nr:hypothetical protein [Actinophytocola xinjiangensis]OLF07570.1 hypothetical protein BLA60_27010 [Actinophytocola xinjiangensis]
MRGTVQSPSRTFAPTSLTWAIVSTGISSRPWVRVAVVNRTRVDRDRRCPASVIAVLGAVGAATGIAWRV